MEHSSLIPGTAAVSTYAATAALVVSSAQSDSGSTANWKSVVAVLKWQIVSEHVIKSWEIIRYQLNNNICKFLKLIEFLITTQTKFK